MFITYIVYTPSGRIRKAEHVASMKTYIPQLRERVVTSAVQSVPQAVDLFSVLVLRQFLSY